MNFIKKFLHGKKLAQLGLVIGLALAFAAAPVFSGLASAEGNAQVIHVSGTFATTNATNLCDDIEDCVVDALTGSFNGGTNRLITVGFTESANYIAYHDSDRIDTNGYGVFEGEEYGIIDVNTEEFHSVSVSTSTDGCGSKLTLHMHGTIDLDSPGLEDQGTYEGILVKKNC